jgi:hypothetical protein
MINNVVASLGQHERLPALLAALAVSAAAVAGCAVWSALRSPRPSPSRR